MNAPFIRQWLSSCRWTPLAVWLAVLASVASLAAIRASLLPLWPRAEPLPAARVASSLKQAGLAATAVPLKDPQGKPERNHDRALSQTLVFRFSSGEDLRLVRGVVRNPLEFKPETFTKRRKDLLLANGKPAGPPPQTIGTIAGRPARQTCLVALSPQALGYGVKWEPLGELVKRSASGRTSMMRRLVGLEASRTYACVLITLRNDSTAPVNPALWSRLLQVLPEALTPSSASGAAAPASATSP